MKTGVNTVLLVQVAPTLKLLLEVDPRGGYFRQTDIEMGLHAHASKVEFKANFEANALNSTKGPMDFEKYIKRLAYGWRVMLAHTREKAVAYWGLKDADKEVATHPKDLRELYGIIKPQTIEAKDTTHRNTHGKGDKDWQLAKQTFCNH